MRNNKGITVIVLVLVIIIMLILAAVGVNIILDDSIIEETIDATDDANGRVMVEEVTTNILLNEWSTMSN